LDGLRNTGNRQLERVGFAHEVLERACPVRVVTLAELRSDAFLYLKKAPKASRHQPYYHVLQGSFWVLVLPQLFMKLFELFALFLAVEVKLTCKQTMGPAVLTIEY